MATYRCPDCSAVITTTRDDVRCVRCGAVLSTAPPPPARRKPRRPKG